jgi:hypothetical protein
MKKTIGEEIRGDIPKGHSNIITENDAFMRCIKPAPRLGGFRMDGYWIWCASVVGGDDGKYHMFASRWSKKMPMFSGYILSSEIVRAESSTRGGPYVFREKVLPQDASGRWDARMAHNPCVIKYNGIYLLYYIGSTFSGPIMPPAGNAKSPQCIESYANIRIGLATAASPCGPWITREEPILLPRPGKWDDSIVTNPAPCIGPDGQVLLYYRSNTPDGLRIGVACADTPEGPYRRLSDEPILRFDSGDYVEDPFVWWAGDHYEMIAKDMLGGITGEMHAGAHFESQDGVNWHPKEPAKAYSRTIAYDDGTSMTLGSLERPQLLLDENGDPEYLFAAAADGPGGFYKASNTWSIAIPLK